MSAPKNMTTINVSSLRVGITLTSPIYNTGDNDNVLLLASGTTLTTSLLDRLIKRGITQVSIESDEINSVRQMGNSKGKKKFKKIKDVRTQTSSKEKKKKLSFEKEEAESNHVKFKKRKLSSSELKIERKRLKEESETQQKLISQGSRISKDSFINSLTPRSCDGHTNVDVEKALESREESAKRIDMMYQAFQIQDFSQTAKTAEVTAENLLQIANDIDVFLSIGIKKDCKNYPSHHSLQTAILAMSMGTIHGLKKEELIELGIGCLIHDAGMLHLKQPVHEYQRALSELEFLEITKHPMITMDMLRGIPTIPKGSLMVAYQMHERCDGSGYPRRRKCSQIHYYAKIAAVADVYVALVSDRPHRPGMLPYHAVEQILHSTQKGLFDPVIARSLLHTVSLFPIGSFVELSDGRIGRVIRSNRDNYLRPVIEIWTTETVFGAPETIDLRQDDLKNITISRPIPAIKIGDDELVVPDLQEA